ncbi:hypothetical protein P7F70_09000 [Streptococcus pluranimalium]|uniref:hypothetical protein n=1 Tax=Streptococcus pluranimalium TaxID=82348 RepID=UPI0024157B45|nr:hypothetical protein [Streptococcus pluranimalium]WFM79637.1 hypothetical protein P7F70_09000 [Streptococcus pluranimalium]
MSLNIQKEKTILIFSFLIVEKLDFYLWVASILELSPDVRFDEDIIEVEWKKKII